MTAFTTHPPTTAFRNSGPAASPPQAAAGLSGPAERASASGAGDTHAFDSVASALLPEPATGVAGSDPQAYQDALAQTLTDRAGAHPHAYLLAWINSGIVDRAAHRRRPLRRCRRAGLAGIAVGPAGFPGRGGRAAGDHTPGGLPRRTDPGVNAPPQWDEGPSAALAGPGLKRRPGPPSCTTRAHATGARSRAHQHTVTAVFHTTVIRPGCPIR
jgi:hypothetical protein